MTKGEEDTRENGSRERKIPSSKRSFRDTGKEISIDNPEAMYSSRNEASCYITRHEIAILSRKQKKRKKQRSDKRSSKLTSPDKNIISAKIEIPNSIEIQFHNERVLKTNIAKVVCSKKIWGTKN